MKDLFLIPIMLAMFAFGYYLMPKVDHFMEENQRLFAVGNQNCQGKVRIAAESPLLFDAIASALESCSVAYPNLEFYLSSGRTPRILKKLLDEEVDIILLADERLEHIETQYGSLLIPYKKRTEPVSMLGLPVEALDEIEWIHVIWKNKAKAKNRDRVIGTLVNEHCSVKCGYADYLD